MIAGLFLLIVLGAIGLAVAAVIRRTSGAKPDSAAGSARRVVVFGLLFGLVTVTAIGIVGLVERMLDGGEIAGSDVTGLARALAFTLIAGPIAAFLWWFLWKGIDDPGERASLGWSLYTSAMTTVSLIVTVSATLSAAAAAVGGRLDRSGLSTGIVWALVWVWHNWMRSHPIKGPTTLTDIPEVAGSYFGLAIVVIGSLTALTSLVQQVVDAITDASTFGDPWWNTTLRAMVWVVGGAGVWWWHWIRQECRGLETGLADTALVVGGTLIPGAVAIGGLGTVVFTVLMAIADPDRSITQLTEPVAPALSAVTIGGAVWAYHRIVIRNRTEAVRQSTRLLGAGLGLVVAASGIGIVVNSILDAITPELAGSGAGRELLMGGLSALTVGGPLWWLAWQPTNREQAPATTGRRIYLVAVFGLSALVAVITLLFIGYRVFEFALDDVTGTSLIDRIRVPFGLLTATGIVAGYHYPVWRRDRAIAESQAPTKRVGHVILVTGSEPTALREAIASQTGAAVTVWMRSDVNGAGPSSEHLAEALEGVEGDRLMVVTGPGARVEVIPLRS